MSAFFKCLVDDLALPSEFVELLVKMINDQLEEYDLSGGEVGIIIADNPFIHHLNKTYRNKDDTTDVLSFSYLEPEMLHLSKEEEFAVGEIYISLDRASEQADQAGHSLLREILLLVIHGLMHLMGFDHADPEEAVIMQDTEQLLLMKYECK